VPGDIVGQPAPESRPDYRGHDDSNPVHRDGLAALLGRECIHQNRRGDRHHAAAAQALHDAEQQQQLESPGNAAQHRARGEQHQTDQEEGLAADRFVQKRAYRQTDGVGDQIGGHYP